MKLTEIAITVGKNRQERQYEPIKIEIHVKADVSMVDDANLDSEFHGIRDVALRQLDISFEERYRFLRMRKQELEKLKNQRDSLEAEFKNLQRIVEI